MFRSLGDYKSPFSKQQPASSSVPHPPPQKILKPDIQGKGPQVQPLYPGPSVNQLVDQFAYPKEKDYGGKDCSCTNCPKKVDASCSCAEPYKDALWNFIQCMQACIESVLTEIDKIRAAQEFQGKQSSGKFARSLPDLDRLREVVLEYKNKLTNFDHLKTLTYQTDGGEELLVKTLEELSPILMLRNVNESDVQPSAVEILSSIDPEVIEQLDDIKICDFRTFIHKVVDMLKKRELTYEQIRELCLLAIKQCVESEQNLIVTDDSATDTNDTQDSQEVYPKDSSNFNR